MASSTSARTSPRLRAALVLATTLVPSLGLTSSEGGPLPPTGERVDLFLPEQAHAPAALEVAFSLAGSPAALVLERQSLRAEEFRVLVQGHDGIHAQSPGIPRTYRGTMLRPDHADATVVASLLPDGLHGWIRLDDGEFLEIRPQGGAGASRQSHRIAPVNGSGLTNARCGLDRVIEASRPTSRPDGLPKSLSGSLVVEIAIDTDVEFCATNGPSITSNVDDIESVLNGVELLYEAELGLTFALTAVVVRTAEPDPYSSKNPVNILTEIGAAWTTGSLADVPRDVVHLMTGKSLTGGAIGFANNGVVCNSQYGVGLSRSKYTSVLAQRVVITAHELGHNFGASHCSGSDCHVMCPTLGGCSGSLSQFGAVAEQEVAAFLAGADCLTSGLEPLPLPVIEPFAGHTLEDALWSINAGTPELSMEGGAPSPPFALRLDASSGTSAQDAVQTAPLALGGQAGASLTYRVKRVGVESQEALVVEALSASGSWLEVDRVVSSGSGATAYEPRQVLLTGAASWDGARLRFRAEVSDGSDQWFVDDVRVDPAPDSKPTITAVAPTMVDALEGGTVTVDGTGFSAAGLQLKVDGVAIAWFTVVSDTKLTFNAPNASKLGAVTVVASSSGGASNPGSLTYQANDPPKVSTLPVAFNGSNINVAFAGEPGDTAFLIASITGTTSGWNGSTLLVPSLAFVPLGVLSGTGVGLLSAPIAGAPPGLTFYLQVLTVGPSGGAGSIDLSNIASTVVFF